MNQPLASRTLDVLQIREDFPILQAKTPWGKPLVYLDNAATTQKPKSVVESMSDFYLGYNANVHRGAYWPATSTSAAYELARSKVAQFLNAPSPNCIVFTAGSTDGINKVVSTYLSPMLDEGDKVLISAMEHHSNLVPWQQACKNKGAQLQALTLDQNGDLDLEEIKEKLSPRTKMVAISAVSNTLGLINSLPEIINAAHEMNIPVLVDAAQSVAHYPTDVLALDCDFLVFSGHKIFGPTGIGVLYGKEELLQKMVPMQYGGGMIKNVTLENSLFADTPKRHEAGTPNIAGAIGLAAALGYITKIGFGWIKEHNQELLKHALSILPSVDGFELVGDPQHRAPLFSFNLAGVHPHDVASLLADEGIAIRAGHHCTQPLLDLLQVPSTCRVSFALYNTLEEVDLLKTALEGAKSFF